MKNEFIDELTNNAVINVIDIGLSGDSVREIIKNGEIYYIKESTSNNLDREYFIMNYLKGKIPVPEVVYYCYNGEKTILVTKKLQGEMICEDDIFDNAELVISLAAKGLKILQNYDINGFPIYNGIDAKLAIAKYNLDNGLVKTENMNEENIERFGTIENVYSYLISNKPKEKLCLSHGDYSIPNVFYEKNEITGFLDLGDMGLADYWYDIAILVKSIRNNYEDKKYEDYLFKTLGIDPDYERIEYYILLTELFL